MKPAEKSALADVYSAEAARRNTSIHTWTAVDPQRLGALLRAFEKGDFHDSAEYFESALKYDAHLKCVADKRFSDVASRAWEIQLLNAEEEDADAMRQLAVLKDFFDLMRFSTAQKRDMRQSVSALVEWLMTASFLGYSAVAADYSPAMTADGIPTFHAHFCGVPLSYFEARERELRLCKEAFGYFGEKLEHGTGKWIVGVYGKIPLVFASMVLYMLKTTPLQDWANAVERFGMPFVLLKTPAKKGSAEWQAAADAVRKLGANFSGVFGKDVETEVSSIASGAGAPHQQLVEYLDRRISILWRGGDMATESRAGADVGGVSLQGEERSIISESDASFVEELIDSQIVQPLLRRVFGAGVKQKAFFRFVRAKRENLAVAREKLTLARESGLVVSKAWAYDVLGIPPPKSDEETLAFPQASAPAYPAQNALANAEAGEDKGEGEESEENAKNKQWSAFLLALAELRDVPEVDFPEKLKEFSERFPQIADEVLTRNDVAEILAEHAVEKIRKELEK